LEISKKNWIVGLKSKLKKKREKLISLLNPYSRIVWLKKKIKIIINNEIEKKVRNPK